jgi:hypothetical protein
MTEGPRQAVYRSSCDGVSVRLRANVGDQSWLIIKKPGVEALYRDIPEDQVSTVVDQFLAIETDPQKFAAFVNAYSTQ